MTFRIYEIQIDITHTHAKHNKPNVFVPLSQFALTYRVTKNLFKVFEKVRKSNTGFLSDSETGGGGDRVHLYREI